MSTVATTTPSNYAAKWNLNPQSTAIPKTESAFPLGAKGVESVIGKDTRTLVPAADIADGGKYRAIIKLFVRYEKQPNDGNWGMATGWLIAPDLLVTAGHVAFDFGPTTQYGKAVIVKAYMGYAGAVNLTPASLSSFNGAAPAVQLRYGATFITTSGWLQSAGQAERADVAFLKLNAPFTGKFTPFSYLDTPSSATSENIGVVGYPADEKNPAGEEGADMYEAYAPSTWNLATGYGNLLTYTISTYPGQSGSPVIRSSDGAAIGVHVLGGTVVNSASEINGIYGNNFSSFIRAFTENTQPIGSILNVNIIKPSTVGPDTLNLNGSSIINTTSSGTSTESSLGTTTTPAVTVTGNTEGFLDVLKDIGKVALPIISTGLQIASPFLGPIGPPAAAIGGVALGALSKACESAFQPATESFQPASPPSVDALAGCAQRAVLAESALQAALKLDSTTPQGQQILSEMANTYSTLKPLHKLHTKLFPAIAGPAIRIALNNTVTPAAGTESSLSVRKPLPDAAAVESSFGTSINPAFATALLQPTVLVPGQESFFDDLGSVISTGLQYATPIISAIAQSGVESALTASTSSGTESALATTTPDSVISAPLFQRALVAECALQAVQKVDTPTLTALPLYDEAGNLETEGFFDFMKTTMQTIGSQVLAVAPDVIKNVAPIAINLVANAIQSKTGGTSGGTTGGKESNLPPSPTPSSSGLAVPPVSIQALADSTPGTPNPANDITVSTFPSVATASTSAAALRIAPPLLSRVESRKAAMKKTGFHNLDGLIFRPAPWKENADHPAQ